jgi:hypothetical protein
MAKLKNIEWSKEGMAGDKVVFISSLTVDSDGIFYLSLPEFLIETARSLKIKNRFSYKEHRIVSKTLKDGQDAIGQIIDEYLACEKTSEMIIRYDYIASCHYAKDPNGEIHPNGTYCEGGYHWNKPIGRTTRSEMEYTVHDYSVGFKATVVLKTTYNRNASKRIKYKDPDEELLGEYGNKLNAFCRVVISNNSHELPYSERTAKLFYESMLALCHVADKLDVLLNRPDNLLDMSGKLLIS